MARLVHDLGRGVELRLERRRGLHDLGRGHQGALLAVQELRQRVGLEVAADLGAALVVEAIPQICAVDRDVRVRHPHRVVGIDVLRPVEALRRIPLLLLALAIEREQVGAAVLVFPGERGRGLAFHLPLGLLDGQAIEVGGRHALSLIVRSG